jgi:hypothetical protein
MVKIWITKKFSCIAVACLWHLALNRIIQFLPMLYAFGILQRPSI